MMWEMRRQYSGEVTYCWPVSCWPDATSQRRNSAFSRPSPWRVTRPTTTACALICFQLAKVGGASGLLMRSMKADGSIGANRPLRLRLLVMTPATSAPAWASAGVPGTKAGIAIGIGWNASGSTRSRPCAHADRRPKAANVDPVAIMKWRRVTDRTLLIGMIAFAFEIYSMSLRPNVIGMYFQVSYWSFGRNA